MTRTSPETISQIRSSSVEELYARIGNAISQAIDGAWAEAWYAFEQEEEDASTSYGRYIRARPFEKAQNIELDLETGVYVSEAFETLRKRLRTEGEAPWTRAVFTLYPTGRFDLAFDYGPLEGYPWQRARALVEERRQTGSGAT